MALVRAKEAHKMSQKEREDKIKELKLELVRASVGANKTNAKTKEIKRAISRLLTAMKVEKFNTSRKEKELKK